MLSVTGDLLRDAVRLMLEERNFIEDAKQSAQAANIQCATGDKDRIISSTVQPIPPNVVKTHDMFKEVLNEYLSFWTTQPIAADAKFDLPEDKPGESWFDTEDDKKKFDASVKKYKDMFTTSKTPKSKTLFDHLIGENKFEEHAALKACFLAVKLIQQIKFATAWGREDAYSKMRKEMAKKLYDQDEAHSPSEPETSVAVCLSKGGATMVLFNCQTQVTRDIIVHEVGHAQKSAQKEVVRVFNEKAAANRATKHWSRTAARKDLSQIEAEGLPVFAGVENIVQLMGDLNVSKAALQQRFSDFVAKAPDPSISVNVAKQNPSKGKKSTRAAPPDPDRFSSLMTLGNYTLLMATRKRFENIFNDFSRAQRSKKDEKGEGYQPYDDFIILGSKVDDDYLMWLRNPDEAINFFREIDFANRKLERDRGDAYKSLQDVRPEIWAVLKQSQASKDGGAPAVPYAILGLMGPKKSSDLKGLTAVAVNEPAGEKSSQLAEAHQLASLARGYMNVKRSSSINLIRSLVREDIKKLR